MHYSKVSACFASYPFTEEQILLVAFCTCEIFSTIGQCEQGGGGGGWGGGGGGGKRAKSPLSSCFLKGHIGLMSDTPTSHKHHFYGVTKGFTMLNMKTKYVCQGLISSHGNFCKIRMM